MTAFSVILPTYSRNSSGLLSKAIDSVLKQSFLDFELIVVDDGSVDGSSETIQMYKKVDSRVRHIRFSKNIGVPALTTAKAFMESSGDVIAWMFDDCEWRSNYLEAMYGLLENNLDADIGYAQCEVIYPDKTVIFGEPLDINRLKSGWNHIPNGATVIRRRLFDKIGWYDPRVLLLRNNDWDFWQRACDHTRFVFLPKPLAFEYGVGLSDSLGNSYSSDMDLVIKFSKIDRLSELQLPNIQDLNIFTLPNGLLLSDDELESYAAILIEFAIKKWNVNHISEIFNMDAFKKITINMASFFCLVPWLMDYRKKSFSRVISEKDLYIEEQLSYIDKQHKYIEEQHTKIHALHALINSRGNLIKIRSMLNFLRGWLIK